MDEIYTLIKFRTLGCCVRNLYFFVSMTVWYIG